MITLENRGPTKHTLKDYYLSFKLQLVEEVELEYLINWYRSSLFVMNFF